MKTNLKFEAMKLGANFCAAENAVRKLAEEEFMNAPHPDGDSSRFREDMRRHQREVVELWFSVQPLYASIHVCSEANWDEIQDEYFNGSITVSGPQRMMDYEASRAAAKENPDAKPVYRIVPGYINASSWQAGVAGSNARWVRQAMLHRLRMMEMAVSLLNKRNELCLEWEAIESPFEKSRELDRRVAELRKEKEREDGERVRIMEQIRRALRLQGDMTAKQIAKELGEKLTIVESCLQTLVIKKDVLPVGTSGHYRAQLLLPLTAEAK